MSLQVCESSAVAVLLLLRLAVSEIQTSMSFYGFRALETPNNSNKYQTKSRLISFATAFAVANAALNRPETSKPIVQASF